MSVGGQGEKLVEWSEVAKHGYRESCWVVIHGQVYDITHFLAEVIAKLSTVQFQWDSWNGLPYNRF